MTTYESWVNQGRQSHGYVGNGTLPTDGGDAMVRTNDLFQSAKAAHRIDYTASCSPTERAICRPSIWVDVAASRSHSESALKARYDDAATAKMPTTPKHRSNSDRIRIPLSSLREDGDT